MDIEAIRKLKTHYKEELYTKTRTNQREDQEYFDDSFTVKEIQAPHTIFRSKLGAKIVNSAAEQIVTQNPQVFVDILSGRKESSERLSAECNKIWISLLKLQNPEPVKQSVKNQLRRGESYVKLAHSESWVSKKCPKCGKELDIKKGEWACGCGFRKPYLQYGLPVLFLIPDPMVIYGSPQEDDCGWLPNVGVPNKVIVFYERQPWDVLVRYPSWTNPNKAGIDNNNKVEWMEYWDKDSRYFEADGVPVLQTPNPYHCTPFVRKRSGFGSPSPDGELASLIVSDLFDMRDLLKQECILRSNINSIETLYAQRPRTFLDEGAEVSEDEINKISFAGRDINVIHMARGLKLLDDLPPVPSQEMYAHHQQIVSEIAQRRPFILAGFPFGESGRQEDLTHTYGMQRYASVVEGTENQFATAFDMALHICKIVPGLQPKGLRTSDLEANFKCSIKLRAEDPLERERKLTAGDRLWAQGNGSISLKTFHLQYQGMTENQHEEEVDQMMVDKLTLYNPDVAAVYGMVVAEETAMEKWLQALKQRDMMLQQQQKGLQDIPPKTTQERTQGQFRPGVGPEGMDMAFAGRENANKGTRQPPADYERNERQ